MKTILSTLAVICLLSSNLDAQLRGIGNRLKNKLEDKIVEKASKPIEDAIDEAFEGSAKDDPSETPNDNATFTPSSSEEVDWGKVSNNYQGMLDNLNEDVNLPASYSFNLTMNVRIEDYDGKEEEMKMYYGENSNYVGMAPNGNEEDLQLVVIDQENDLMAMYQKEDGKQVVRALPNALTMSKTFSGMQTDSAEDEEDSFQFAKTGQTKKLLGYTAYEYLAEDEEENITFYATPDFPVSWEEIFGDFSKDYVSAKYNDLATQVEGMVLYSKAVKKDNPKEVSIWEVTEIKKEEYTVNNSEWELQKFGGE